MGDSCREAMTEHPSTQEAKRKNTPRRNRTYTSDISVSHSPSRAIVRPRHPRETTSPTGWLRSEVSCRIGYTVQELNLHLEPSQPIDLPSGSSPSPPRQPARYHYANDVKYTVPESNQRLRSTNRRDNHYTTSVVWRQTCGCGKLGIRAGEHDDDAISMQRVRKCFSSRRHDVGWMAWEDESEQ